MDFFNLCIRTKDTQRLQRRGGDGGRREKRIVSMGPTLPHSLASSKQAHAARGRRWVPLIYRVYY